jgi:hypothetical protein
MNYFAQGKIAELRVAQRLLEAGYHTYFPSMDGGATDLLAIKGTQTIRIQVKSGKLVNGVAIVYLQKQRNHSKTDKYYRYSLEEVDYFAHHVIDTDEVLWISNASFHDKQVLHIRKGQTKNNQAKGIHVFENFLQVP